MMYEKFKVGDMVRLKFGNNLKRYYKERGVKNGDVGIIESINYPLYEIKFNNVEEKVCAFEATLEKIDEVMKLILMSQTDKFKNQ